jgi:hypothetical protein
MLTEFKNKYGFPMIMWCVVVTVIMVVDGLATRKLVYDADTMEALRLDIMALESRLGRYIRENGDRVVAALNRHGAKLDELGAEHRRATFAMAVALDRQEEQMDMFAIILNRLVNATLFQVDVHPLIHGFEAVVKSARTEARAAAESAREAVIAANKTQEAVKEAVAAVPSAKAAPTPGYGDWQYWWGWWQASWSQPLSIFLLGFSLYQAESRAHTVLFFVMGTFFNPYLGGMALFIVPAKWVAAWCRSTKPWVQLTPCGRYCCPRSDADLARDEELADLGPARPVGVRAGAAMAHSTFNETALDTTTAPIGFWAYARGWLNPFFQYAPLGACNSFDVWYVLVHPVK